MRLLIPLLILMIPIFGCEPRLPQENTQVIPDQADSLTVFLVVLDEGAPAGRRIGCNDRLVPYTVSPPGVGEEPISASIKALFALHDPPTPFTNALSGSSLQVDAVWIENARAEIYLSGDLVVYGVCHVPRIERQLKETVKTQTEVDSVDVYVNGEPLADLLDVRV